LQGLPAGFLGDFMTGARTNIRLLLWAVPLLAICSFGQSQTRPGTPMVKPGIRHRVKPVPVAPPVVTAPPVPLTLAQQPSIPPQVSYQSGMLTIVAQNSSLGDILREVHRSTGAVIDVPANANERVVTRLGPGPARDVLADLLNGSPFNYVMIGSTADPATLSSVMLTMKTGGVAGSQISNVYQPPAQYAPQQTAMAPGMGPGGPVVQQAASDEEADAEDKDDEDTADEDQSKDQAQSPAEATPTDGSQPNAGPKTPEQILELLRQHRQPGAPPIPPPQPPQSDNNNN
jgi:hypothetical protein